MAKYGSPQHDQRRLSLLNTPNLGELRRMLTLAAETTAVRRQTTTNWRTKNKNIALTLPSSTLHTRT
jgi:hypothetical protein